MENNKQTIQDTISTNIVFYRRQFQMTQLELAQRLNFSDKLISSWERGERTPDIYALVSLSNLFGVSLDTLITKQQKPSKLGVQKGTIAYFYALIPILLMSILFGLFILFEVPFKSWKLFIYALPMSSLVLFVFFLIWRRFVQMYVYLSSFIWTLALSLFVTFPKDNFLYFIIAIPIYAFSMYLMYILLHAKKRKLK